MKRILLHVGTHKTGSTSLQSTFHKHRARLLEAGITYLGGPGAYPHLYSAFMANPMAFEWNKIHGLSEDEVRARDAGVRDELQGLLAESSTDTIILSSEYLAMLSHDDMRSLKAFLEPYGAVTAIYYYRELLSWMSSDSQQLAKVGMRRRPTEYDTAIDRIYGMPLRVHDVFGAAGARFIRFEDAARQGICNALMAMFDLPTLDDLGLEEERVNESISANAVRAMFLYNRLFPLGSGQRSGDLTRELRQLDGPKYQLAGITEAQRDDYARKRDDIQARLGLTLKAPEEIPISDSLDPMTDLLLKLVNRHQRLNS